MIPFITSCCTAILKWYDDKGKVSGFFIVQTGLTLLQGIAMLVCAFVFMTYIQGIIISCICCAVAYVVL